MVETAHLTPAARADKQVRRGLVAEFLAESDILIVDRLAPARLSMAQTLVDLGAKMEQIQLVASYDSAVVAIKTERPNVIFSDFMLGPRTGFELLDVFKGGDLKRSEKLFVLVTANSSQSTIARAAEEEVDTFILKPFSAKSFSEHVSAAVLSRIFPTEYLKRIEEGKSELKVGHLNEALVQFEKATSLDPMPALACYYLGQAESIKSELDLASEKFQEGLGFNKIHFKCLSGLYETLTTQNRLAEAYQVAKRLVQYFPANPKRMSAVLRLAVRTSNFSDVEMFYHLYSQLDERPSDLTGYLCAALSVSARHYLSAGNKSRGLELIEKVGAAAGDDTRFLRISVETLVEHRMQNEAISFMKRFPLQSHRGDDYRVASFLIAALSSAPGHIVEQGRVLLEGGVHTSSVYRALIGAYGVLQKSPEARDLIDQGSQRWPEEADRFKQSLG